MNGLICDKIKNIIKLQDRIEFSKVSYKARGREKSIILVKLHCLLFFKRYIQKRFIN